MSLKNQDHPQGDQDDEERRYFAKIVQSFKFYRYTIHVMSQTS